MITNRSWILTIHKARILRKKPLEKTFLDFKKWVKSIETAGYNGVRTVLRSCNWEFLHLDCSRDYKSQIVCLAWLFLLPSVPTHTKRPRRIEHLQDQEVTLPELYFNGNWTNPYPLIHTWYMNGLLPFALTYIPKSKLHKFEYFSLQPPW